MLKKWFTRTSPFVILAVVSAFILLYQTIFERGGPDGWKYPLLGKLFFLVVIIVAIDLILKRLIQKNYLLWTIELLLCLGVVYYWIVT